MDRTHKANRSTSRQQTSRLPYRRRRLLTPGERRFYNHGLKPAIEDRYLISFKVRLADLITAPDWESPAARRIAQKHVDFVLTTPRTVRVVAVVELNDASHNSGETQQRDAFVAAALQSAGIPLITFPIYPRYDPAKIRHQLLAAIRSFR